MAWSTEPSQVSVDDAILSAVVRFAEGRWCVTLMLSRRPGAGPIGQGDLDLRGVSEDGTTLPVLKRPDFPLVESGGSLGGTANAKFELAGDGRLSRLFVEWRGSSAGFAVVGEGSAP